MTERGHDELDRRIDDVLRASTQPRPDAFFRTRVLARLDGPARRQARRVTWRAVASVACTLVVLVALTRFVRFAPERGGAGPTAAVTSRAQGDATVSPAPSPDASASGGPGAFADRETATGSGVAGAVQLAGTNAAAISTRRGSSRDRMAEAARARYAALAAAAAADAPALPLVSVEGVAVEPVAVPPLAATDRFALVGEPEPVAIEPIRVGSTGNEP